MSIFKRKNKEESGAGRSAEKKKQGGKKPYWKWLIAGAAVVAGGVAAILILGNGGSAAASAAVGLTMSDITVLQAGEVRNSISATGTVESAKKRNVYTTMNYTVANVLVEVGDVVQEGDVLLELDKKSIEKQINEKELSIESSQKSSAQSVKSARDTYNNYKAGIENGTNSSLLSALNSVETALENWEKAQKTYDDYSASLGRGENSTVLNAEKSLSTAQTTLHSAQQEYNTAASALRGAQDKLSAYSVQLPSGTEIEAAQNAVSSAKTVKDNAQSRLDATYASYASCLEDYTRLVNDPLSDPNDTAAALAALTAAEKEYQSAQEAFTLAQSDLQEKEQKLQVLQQASGGSDATLVQLQSDVQEKQSALDAKAKALYSAQDSYDGADASYRSALSSADSTLADYYKAIESAQRSYENALASLNSTEISLQDQLQSYQNSLASSQASANNDLADYQLEELYIDLESAAIKAPASGTVTAVYAMEGASSSGLLFVIEDTENLIVKTNIKEYDLPLVDTGMDVAIRSDLVVTETGEAAGIVSKIAPTSAKAADGTTQDTTDAVFPTEVKVETADSGLRIGTSVRLQFVVEAQTEALSVPYDAIYTNTDGKTCVQVLERQEGGKELVKEMVVEKGVQTDTVISISGEGIIAGLRVINSPAVYIGQIGQEIALGQADTARQPQASAQEGMGNGMSMGGMPFDR